MRVPLARPILRQEASKYGSASDASLPSVATKQGGRFQAYCQDRYTPVLPTERGDPQCGGLDDVFQLSGSDPRFQDDTDEDETAGEEYYSDDDGADGDLMWFDGHEGVSGDFTKTFKEEVAGNRLNSAVTQANVLLERARHQAGT
jgi:hypothetical protein